MRIIGLDVGDKRIGVAVSDELLLCGHALLVHRRTNQTDDLAFFEKLSADQEAKCAVVGLPRNMDGSIGFQAKAAKSFGDALAKRLNLPVIYWDERLTTALAKQTLRDCGATRVQRKGAVDKISAVYILQSYLDSLGSAQRNALLCPEE